MRVVCGLVTVLNAAALVSGIAGPPLVTVSHGTIRGSWKFNTDGHVYAAYEGIPYAQPPVGKFRFKPPVPLTDGWTGVWDGTATSRGCIQYDQFTNSTRYPDQCRFKVVGDEDCLYLNVYVTLSDKQEVSSGADVIVWIHGGAFMFGEGSYDSPEYLMDSKNLIFVNLNYRLGPIGFFSTGDEVVLGNNGLKDQLLALQWVQENIKQFGGDPGKVTLAGMSAGGASVHFHMLSPKSHGLFQSGFSFSGSALCPWALKADVPEQSRRLADIAGCPTDNSTLMVECLLTRSAASLVEYLVHFQPFLYNPFTVFGPMVEVNSDLAFLSQHPRNIMQDGQLENQIPWVTGAVREDGLYPAAFFVDRLLLLKTLDKSWSSLAPFLLFYNDTQPIDTHEKIAELMYKEYLGDYPAIDVTSVKDLVRMLSDHLYIGPMVEAAKLQAAKSPVYSYFFTYEGPESLSTSMTATDKRFGVAHGDDTAYVIWTLNRGFMHSVGGRPMSEFMKGIFLTFVKNQTVPENLSWKTVDSKEEPFQYLHIKAPDDACMENSTDLGNVAVISNVIPN